MGDQQVELCIGHLGQVAFVPLGLIGDVHAPVEDLSSLAVQPRGRGWGGSSLFGTVVSGRVGAAMGGTGEHEVEPHGCAA